MPDNMVLREIVGIVAVALYVVVLPGLLARTLLRRFFEKMGPTRYAIFVMLLLGMVSLPVKMILRWTVNLKYIVAMPEIFFNI
jgi:hypothetical protein